MRRCFSFQLSDILALIFLITLLFFRGSMLGDPGVGWHLKTGEWIVGQSTIPDIDPFLEPIDGYLPWVDDQWLSQILAWGIYQIGNAPLLHLLAAVLCVAPFAFVLPPLLRRRSNSQMLVFLALFLAGLQASVQWIFRPVIISFLLFAIVYRIVSDRIVDAKRPLGYWASGLPILFFFWANLHPGFPLGLLLLALGIFLMREFRGAKAAYLLLVLATCCAATVINPYGFELHHGILRLLGNSYFMSLNREWHRPELLEAAFLPFTILLAILLIGMLWLRPKTMRLFDVGLLVCFVTMALLQRRYLPFLGIVSALPLTVLFEEVRQRLLAPVSEVEPSACSVESPLTILLAIIAGVSALTFHHLPGRTAEFSGIPAYYPHHAVAALAAEHQPGRILHSPDWGGFLTWSLWPNMLAFIDDRNQLVPEQRYRDVLQILAAKDNWQELVEKYRFRWALLSRKEPLAELLIGNSKWKTVFQDAEEDSILFKRIDTGTEEAVAAESGAPVEKRH